MSTTSILMWCRSVLVTVAATLPAQNALQVGELPPGTPVQIAASATPKELTLEIEVAHEWHLYARDTGGGRAIEIVFEPTSAFVADGKPDITCEPDGTIVGTARVRVPLRARDAAADTEPGTQHDRAAQQVDAVFHFMACDPLQCLPPMQVTIRGEIEAADRTGPRVLLVVRERDDRTARIAEFLTSHGLECDVTSYDEVTTELCDARDVVLADSESFGPANKALRAAKAFPRTATPIVAVGFLGTELIEAHGLALTSGYI